MHKQKLGDGLHVKMLSYQYKNSCNKDKTVSGLSYLYYGNPIDRKIVFILGWVLFAGYSLYLLCRYIKLNTSTLNVEGPH